MTVENPKEYLDTNQDGKVEGQEMLDALKQFANREKVWKNVQEFLKTPEAADTKQELQMLSEQEIKNICSKTDKTVDRLLSMVWQANGTYRGEQVYTGEFTGQKITAEDRSYFGILCLYDQLVGKNPNTSGRGYFKDAQYRLRTYREDFMKTPVDVVTTPDGTTVTDVNQDGKADKVETPAEPKKEPEQPVEQTPVEQTPVEQTPVEQTPVEQTPVEQTPVEQTPVEQTPVEQTKIINNPSEYKEKTENNASIFSIVDVPSDSKNDAGKLLDLQKSAKTDLLTAAAHPDLFSYDLITHQHFPKIDKIQDYYAKNPQLGEVKFIMPGATFESGSTLTGLSIDVSGDDKKSVGSDQDILGPKAKGMGLLIITKNGNMILSHASENPSIPEDADVTTLVSVKRNGKLNPQESVYSHTNGHYIVEKQNGDKAILILDDCTPEQKKKILNNPDYNRVLYCDTNGTNGQLDAYWIQKNARLVYAHHKDGNVLRNKPESTNIIQGNMSALFIVYKKYEDNKAPKKEQQEEPKKEQQVEQKKEQQVEQKKEQVKTIDIVQAEKALTTAYNTIKIKYSTQYDFGYTMQDIGLDKKAYTIKDKNSGNPVMEIGIYTTGIKRGLVYMGLDDTIYAEGSADKLDIGVLANQQVFDAIIKNLQEKRQQKPEIKQQTSTITETEEVNEVTPELTPAFINLDAITEEQKTRLENSVVGISVIDLVAKVNNMDDKGLRMQIIDQLLFVDGGAYGMMRLLGLSDHALTSMNQIPSHHKIDRVVLTAMERKNRVYRDYENILLNKKIISDEFGHKAAIPEDVKSAYTMFAYKGLSERYGQSFTSRVHQPRREVSNNGKNYAIVSKTDGHVYLFDSKHALVSRKAALLGKDKSNTPYDVINYTNTSQIPDRTPAGLYTIGNKSYVNGDIGYFITLEPQDKQIIYRTYKSGPNTGKYARSIGFHKIYEPSRDMRNTALQSDNANSKFMTNGCINIDTYSYSELYDHLDPGTAVYISDEEQYS